MSTYIKTGYWDKKAKAPDGWLDLNQFVQTLIPPTPPPTPSTNIYNSDGVFTGNRLVNTNGNNFLFFNPGGLSEFVGNDLNEFAIRNFNIIGIRTKNFPNGISLVIDDRTGINTLFTRYNNQSVGLLFNFQSRVYQLGQITGNNSTSLTIDDAAAFPVQVSGTNVTQNTSGASSGQFLKVKVGGVDYVIDLKNPS